jgi:hypothetical protein
MVMDKIKIKKIVKTCDACPAQWDMWTDANRYVYVRYRWGYFSASYDEAYGGSLIVDLQVGGEYDGTMDDYTMKDILKDVFDFSEAVYE